MATRNHQPNLTVLEYGRLMDTIAAGLDDGQREFRVDELADLAALSDAQVYEALSHMARKHEYVTDSGDGSWQITSDLEA